MGIVIGIGVGGGGGGGQRLVPEIPLEGNIQGIA